MVTTTLPFILVMHQLYYTPSIIILLNFLVFFPSYRWGPDRRCNAQRPDSEAGTRIRALFHHNAAAQSDSHHAPQRWATRTVTAVARRTRPAATRVRYRHTRGPTRSRAPSTSGNRSPGLKCCRRTCRANNGRDSGPPKTGPCCTRPAP